LIHPVLGMIWYRFDLKSWFQITWIIFDFDLKSLLWQLFVILFEFWLADFDFCGFLYQNTFEVELSFFVHVVVRMSACWLKLFDTNNKRRTILSITKTLLGFIKRNTRPSYKSKNVKISLFEIISRPKAILELCVLWWCSYTWNDRDMIYTRKGVKESY